MLPRIVMISIGYSSNLEYINTTVGEQKYGVLPVQFDLYDIIWPLSDLIWHLSELSHLWPIKDGENIMTEDKYGVLNANTDRIGSNA